MLYFNSCPRCSTGTIEYTTDIWGKYLSCLMCGYAIHSRSIRPDTAESASTEPTMGVPSLVRSAVGAESSKDDVDDEPDELVDEFEDLDEADEDESPAHVAFG